jgi:hypothetical protein
MSSVGACHGGRLMMRGHVSWSRVRPALAAAGVEPAGGEVIIAGFGI